MTAFLTKNTADTSTTSYHTSEGFVHIIPRPSLGLGKVVDGRVTSLLTNYDKDKAKYYCYYLVVKKPVKKATKVYVFLGCGTIVRFDYDALEHMEGEANDSVEIGQLELVKELPLKVDVKVLYPDLEPFEF